MLRYFGWLFEKHFKILERQYNVKVADVKSEVRMETLHMLEGEDKMARCHYSLSGVTSNDAAFQCVFAVRCLDGRIGAEDRGTTCGPQEIYAAARRAISTKFCRISFLHSGIKRCWEFKRRYWPPQIDGIIHDAINTTRASWHWRLVWVWVGIFYYTNWSIISYILHTMEVT